MNFEKTYFDYSRLQGWQTNLLTQCHATIPKDSCILEISSDYPRFSGFFKKTFRGEDRVIQVIRGRLFLEKMDNLNFDKKEGVEYSVQMAKHWLGQANVGLLILDCSLFISDLINEFNAWNGYLVRGSRIILPLMEYGIAEGEQVFSLPALVMKETFTNLNLLLPQVLGNIFTCVTLLPGQNIAIADVKRGAINFFNNVIEVNAQYADYILNRMVDSGEAGCLEPAMETELRSSINMMHFSYLIEYYIAERGDLFLALCERVLSKKYPKNGFHYQIDLKTWDGMYGSLVSIAQASSLGCIIDRINRCEDLNQLNSLLMKEQLRIIMLQDIANPLYYMMLENVEI